MADSAPAEPRRIAAATNVWLRAGAGAALIGAGVALYVLAVSLGDGPETIAGCGGTDGGCGHVLQTRWSLWLGLPISALGAALYASLTVLFLVRPTRWTALATAATTACLAGLWFVGLQFGVLGEVCAFCMTTHAAGALAAIAAWRARRSDSASERALPRLRIVALAIVGVAAMVAGQLASEPPDTHAVTTATFEADEGRSATARATYFDGALQLDVDALPVLGDRDAKHFVAFVFDFTCPSCRVLARHLVEAEARYGGAVSVIELVCPINRRCNAHVPARAKERGWACDLAQLACAVFLTDRDAHREFSNWLCRAITEVPPKVARKRAIQLIGEEPLDRALADPRVAEIIDRGGKLFAGLGAGKLPKLIVRDDQVIVGEVHDADDLFEVLEAELGVVPSDDEPE